MKRYIRAVVAGAMLALLFCLVKNFIGHKFPNSSYGMQAAIGMEEIDHLFIGSSLFRQGIDILTLEDNMEGNSYIMSYNGNQPVQILEELKMLLRNDVKIENAYVDLYVYSAALRPAISDTRLIWDLDLGGKVTLYKDMVTYSEAGFPEFFDFFIKSNNEYMVMYPVFYSALQREFYKGGNIRETLGSTSEILDTLGTPGDREGIDPVQKEALREIVTLCNEENINLYFVEVPKYRTLAEADYYIRLRSELEEVVSDCKYVKAEEVVFDNENPVYYQDLFHLSAEGRRTYTKNLVNRMEEMKAEEEAK